MPRQPATGPRAPQMHRSTNRKGGRRLRGILFLPHFLCIARRAVELAGEGFGKTGGGVKGVRDLQSPNKVGGLYTQANEPLFAPSPRWTVSVRPSYDRPPTEWPTPFGFLPFNCLSVQSPRQYFAFDAVGTEQSQRVDWSGPTQLGNT